MLMNFGGPSSIDKVNGFLRNLFDDREIISLPFQSFTGKLIADLRTEKVKNQYMQIGGSSPINHWSKVQGQLLQSNLDKILHKSSPHKCYISFRYTEPSIEDSLLAMAQDDVEDVIVFTQYPQYSCVTTGSNLNELYRSIVRLGFENRFNYSLIDRWGNNSLFILALRNKIQQELDHFDSSERDSVIIMFSAHSIPFRVHERGDLYEMEISQTVNDVMVHFPRNPFRITWQSKVGPITWLGPQTDKALVGFRQAGIKNIIIVPVAFTSDHIEVLYELDMEYISMAKKIGMNVRRTQSFNDDPTFIEAITSIVVDHINSQKQLSNQFLTRCCDCKNQDCTNIRSFLKCSEQKLTAN